MLPLVTLLLLGLALALTVGYLAQSTGICVVRGVRQWDDGRPALLLATLLCGAWTWICIPVANHFGLQIPIQRHDVALMFAVGGLIFGIGAAINGGCAVSTLSKLAAGNVHMVATLSGWVAGWALWLWLRPTPELPPMTPPTPLALWALIGASVFLLALAVIAPWEQRKLWVSITFFGIAGGLLTLLEPRWSPSALVTDLGALAADEPGTLVPSIYRIALISILLGGMALSAWRAHHFKLQRPGFRRLTIHLGAGTLMGVGAAMALGGNDVQLLAAVPALSPAGLVTVLFMLLGTWTTLRLMGRLAR